MLRRGVSKFFYVFLSWLNNLTCKCVGQNVFLMLVNLSLKVKQGNLLIWSQLTIYCNYGRYFVRITEQ